MSKGRIVTTDHGWEISGDWTLDHYPALRKDVERVRTQRRAGEPLRLEQLGELDTAGAGLLSELLGPNETGKLQADGVAPEKLALLQTVSGALARAATPGVQPKYGLRAELAHVGRTTEDIWLQQRALLGFLGITLQTLAFTLVRPRKWRLTPLAVHIERTGLDAMPIVALLTFMVGAVVAFLGATVLSDFGATIYTVNLVAYSFLREFGVLLAAILMAGRTGSAFAAQIGSMKANEEVDAIRALGLDPVELLVLPRVLAMTITLPVLTFVGMLSGLLGGLAVCMLALEISPLMYVSILQRDIELIHFLVGISKAPVFAFLIAVIGCLEGFKVSGSAQSVGEHTTSAVVQSIFLVILLDALAAMFFMQMDW
jgi:phospholipid/cholesterol/gamma-HCH transport system permease protein